MKGLTYGVMAERTILTPSSSGDIKILSAKLPAASSEYS